MDSIGPTTRIYQTHRDNQRERILKAAETLFVRDGLNTVSMGDIAKTAQMARITLYQYFTNKEDIAWAIFQKTVEYFKVDLTSLPSSPTENAYQRLEKVIEELVSHWDSLSEHFCFIVEFNTMYVRNNKQNSVRKVVEQSWTGVYDLTIQLIQQGIKDGSLRSDLNPRLTAAAFSNLVNSVSSWFALLGNQIEFEYSQPILGIYQDIFNNFLSGIQAKF